MKILCRYWGQHVHEAHVLSVPVPEYWPSKEAEHDSTTAGRPELLKERSGSEGWTHATFCCSNPAWKDEKDEVMMRRGALSALIRTSSSARTPTGMLKVLIKHGGRRRTSLHLSFGDSQRTGLQWSCLHPHIHTTWRSDAGVQQTVLQSNTDETNETPDAVLKKSSSSRLCTLLKLLSCWWSAELRLQPHSSTDALRRRHHLVSCRTTSRTTPVRKRQRHRSLEVKEEPGTLMKEVLRVLTQIWSLIQTALAAGRSSPWERLSRHFDAVSSVLLNIWSRRRFLPKHCYSPGILTPHPAAHLQDKSVRGRSLWHQLSSSTHTSQNAPVW